MYLLSRFFLVRQLDICFWQSLSSPSNPPMTTPNIEQVEKELVEVICKAVPEIQGEDELCPKCGGSTATQSDPDCQYCKLCELNDAYNSVAWKKELLRPITLEDVLRAMRGPNRGLGKYYIECVTGRIIESQNVDHETSRDADTGVVWHFGKPLHEQSPETKLFLHSLLTK